MSTWAAARRRSTRRSSRPGNAPPSIFWRQCIRAWPRCASTFSTATPRHGSTLTATIAGAGERPVRLLLVDAEGKLSLLGAASQGSAADGSATVAARVDSSAAAGATPHIVVALVGDFPIAVPEGAAASYFPGLADTLLGSSQEFGLDFAHFRPSAPDEATSFAPQPYTEGTIRPNHNQQQLDGALIDFYRQWKRLYVAQECGEGRHLLKVNADGKAMEGGSAPDWPRVSEAHGYGMLALALMAGADPEAQTAFNGMYHYRADHPARSSPHLIAWNQVEGCGNAGEEHGGDNSATDGDLDIAYALLLADKAWGSDGRIDYRAAALDMIEAIMKHEVSASGDFLLLGDWAATSNELHFRAATRSSDFMLSHLKAFADATGEQRWHGLRDSTYGLIDTMTRKFSPKTGLMPVPLSISATSRGRRRQISSKARATAISRGTRPATLADRARLSAARRGAGAEGARRAQQMGAPQGQGQSRRACRHLSSRRQGGARRRHRRAHLRRADGRGRDGRGRQPGLAQRGLGQCRRAQKIEDDDFYGNTLKLLAMIAMSGHWTKP